MTVTLSRLYNNHSTATGVMTDLEAAGIPHSDISVVSNNATGWYKGATTPSGKVDRDRDGVDDRAEGAGGGAGIGAAVGGVAGLLAGLGMIAIPGIGPVVAAGWLASTALGAVVGGVAGGAIGALTEAGVSKEDAPLYAEGLRRGGTLVTVRFPDADRARVEAILDRKAVNVRERSAQWRKEGWTDYDPKAPPFTADEIDRQNKLYP